MYFERHAPTNYTKVTYKLFRELRTKGIRMRLAVSAAAAPLNPDVARRAARMPSG
jgi:hypothetical protein